MCRAALLLLGLSALACTSGMVISDADALYNSVVAGDYNSAVWDAKQLNRKGQGRIITEVVDRLIKDSVRNTVDFAYKLWIDNEKDIIKERFPIQFRIVLAGLPVTIINKRDNLALKLGVATDSAGDRIAYGDKDDKSTDNVSWKIVAFFENKQVYFKIENTKRHQYLKAGTDADDAGDHNIYGESGADSYRHHWYLLPASNDGQVLFYIINREYRQPLKLGRALDSMGDRTAFSHNGQAIGNPELYGWKIFPF